MTLQKCTETKQAFNALVKIEKELSIEKAIVESPLIVAQGKKKSVVSEIIIIIEFFLNVTGKELEEYQIQILAGDLYEKFKTDALEDIVLMFKMARQGEFGKVYKCDTFEIMDWSNRYLESKSATRERLLKKKKEPRTEVKAGKYFSELPKELQEKFATMVSPKKDFLPRKAVDALTREKMHRELDKKIKKEK
ncbi:hypothetical protein [Chryseobacterium sp. R2A-55]|uniref:hypothetical protein n=1 Tax=Chryseobacterium sp. R2A-55 TaxID=2744445 RepID=UPI001F23A6C2|nr:hypothetical protein [Chryseobacterium sp. R2A-55]